MEPLLETIDLDIDESNELKFKIKMEGNVSSPAKVRLVCEGEEFAYIFKGYGTNEMDVVQFTLPRMENKLKEGTYNAKVEVLVENRYFAPLQFQINFKKSISVVAEAVKLVSKPQVNEVKVTAAPVTVTRVGTGTIKFEQKPEEKKTIKESVEDVSLVEEQKYAKKLKTIQDALNGKNSLRDAYLSKKKK